MGPQDDPREGDSATEEARQVENEKALLQRWKLGRQSILAFLVLIGILLLWSGLAIYRAKARLRAQGIELEGSVLPELGGLLVILVWAGIGLWFIRQGRRSAEQVPTLRAEAEMVRNRMGLRRPGWSLSLVGWNWPAIGGIGICLVAVYGGSRLWVRLVEGGVEGSRWHWLGALAVGGALIYGEERIRRSLQQNSLVRPIRPTEPCPPERAGSGVVATPVPPFSPEEVRAMMVTERDFHGLHITHGLDGRGGVTWSVAWPAGAPGFHIMDRQRGSFLRWLLDLLGLRHEDEDAWQPTYPGSVTVDDAELAARYKVYASDVDALRTRLLNPAVKEMLLGLPQVDLRVDNGALIYRADQHVLDEAMRGLPRSILNSVQHTLASQEIHDRIGELLLLVSPPAESAGTLPALPVICRYCNALLGQPAGQGARCGCCSQEDLLPAGPYERWAECKARLLGAARRTPQLDTPRDRALVEIFERRDHLHHLWRSWVPSGTSLAGGSILAIWLLVVSGYFIFPLVLAALVGHVVARRRYARRLRPALLAWPAHHLGGVARCRACGCDLPDQAQAVVRCRLCYTHNLISGMTEPERQALLVSERALYRRRADGLLPSGPALPARPGRLFASCCGVAFLVFSLIFSPLLAPGLSTTFGGLEHFSWLGGWKAGLIRALRR